MVLNILTSCSPSVKHGVLRMGLIPVVFRSVDLRKKIPVNEVVIFRRPLTQALIQDLAPTTHPRERETHAGLLDDRSFSLMNRA